VSRYLSACLTALYLGFCGVSSARAQDSDVSEPVDIRPAVSRARAPTAQRTKPHRAVVAAPKLEAASEGGETAEQPSAKPKPVARSAVKHVVAARSTRSKKPASPASAATSKPASETAAQAAKSETAESVAKPNADQKDSMPVATTAQKPAAPASAPADFCSNIADLAAETRAKVRADQVAALEADLRTRISELEAKRAEVQAWVEKQEEVRRRADEAVLAILGKMKPESAAAQIALMEDPMAAAVLMKLGAKSASAILNDMGASKAARITETMMAQRVASRNDGVKSAN
jgi:flagellar motility protein MotE (MotC chaperone)